MDKKDKQILFELNRNCRQSNTAIAKKLRISKQVVSYRIRKIEEDYVKSYSALINWRKLGYSALRIYLKWEDISPKIRKEVHDYVAEDPLFMWSVIFEGDFDFALYAWVRDVPRFSDKWDEFLERFGEYVRKKEACESVKMIHFPMKPLVESYPLEERVVGTGEKEEYDDTDYEILKIIATNARIPTIKIAEKIGVSARTVVNRMKVLEKKGIVLGYNAIFDLEKMGYSFFKIDFYLNDFSKLREMKEFARRHKNIVYMMKTIGGPDFEIEIMVKNQNEVHSIISEIQEEFWDVISHHRAHRFRTVKQTYLPGA